MTHARALVVNLVGATTDRPRVTELRALVSEFHPDVILAVEANDMRLARVLGRGWIVQQGWIRGRQNGAVAVRRAPGVRRFGLRFLTGSPRSRGIAPRWVIRLSSFHSPGAAAVCWQSAHAAPRRNRDLYPGFIRNLRLSWAPRFTVTGGDMNQAAIDVAARRKGLRWYETEVMFLASSLPFTATAHTRRGFDHPVIVADVDLTPTEK